jgi:hypothetical protein
VTLGIAGEQAASGHQCALVADGGEDVAEFAVARRGIADAVGGEDRKMQVAGDFEGDAVAGFFFAMIVALQFDVDVVVSEDAGEAIDHAMGFGGASFFERGGERAFIASGEADEAGGMMFEFVLEDGAFFFALGAQLHAGDELAEVLIAGAGSDEEGKAEVAGGRWCSRRESRSCAALG